MVECKNCVTCQNCYSCQGSCYTCEVGYGGDDKGEEELACNVRQISQNAVVEKVEFPDILHAIYDALDRIAYQLEIVNELKRKELDILSKVQIPVKQNIQRQVPNRGKTNVKRRALKPVEDELRMIPDRVGKVKIRKQLNLK